MGHHDMEIQADGIVAANLHHDHLSVHWANGDATRFHYQWLRDNCRSPERFDERTGERKSLIESIPADLKATDAELCPEGIRVSWSDGAADSKFDAIWLRRNAYDRERAEELESDLAPWGCEYGNAIESFDYPDVMSDDGAAAQMIAAFQRRGLVRLGQVPIAEREVERFAGRLAYVREIAFDRVADIRVSVDPYTLGFTNAALPLHTDCSGYSWPPNVMVFHCLVNEVAGGQSQYVDGVRVVSQLRAGDPEAFRLLTECDVEFRLWSKKADTLMTCPPIILDKKGNLAILRYANWTIQPLKTVPFDLVPKWYDAWRALADRVNAPENRVSYRCEPGELLLINNHRVLHGRNAFDDGEGARHFQQVYMELDDLAGFRRIAEGAGGPR